MPGKRSNGVPEEHGLSIGLTITQILNAGRQRLRSGIARGSNTRLPKIHAVWKTVATNPDFFICYIAIKWACSQSR
jgi:hypothetical protein